MNAGCGFVFLYIFLLFGGNYDALILYLFCLFCVTEFMCSKSIAVDC